jgi:hypothetical protein
MSGQESKKKKRRPIDLNKLAFSILTDAVGEDKPNPPTEEDEKNPHAVALGRLGGLKGGKARAEKLTPEERRKIAQKAAEARWAKQDK